MPLVAKIDFDTAENGPSKVWATSTDPRTPAPVLPSTEHPRFRTSRSEGSRMEQRSSTSLFIRPSGRGESGAGRSTFGGLVLGCIDADFCKQILVGKLLTRSTRFTNFATAPHSKIQLTFVKHFRIIRTDLF